MTTVLVVDDSPTIRAMIVELLKSHGMKTLEAEDGAIAKQLLSDSNIVPDLVITDIVMPNMNGYEFCRWVKNNPTTTQVPVIMCTTKGEDFDKHWGKRQGSDAYITKPFEGKEMLATVSSLLKAQTAP
ncbi:response regulator [Lyngbya confervoides]|uniref:Response regulator n=1 Tax=Lyngbya confervoides BDU141951 TaxID=1574623 RepID=A0ABD4T373_9CYAN|nr:response regulator [Lyngbya confervoides]MCM1983192.1 response regulator [Lyngbya confervoides BDU141951]